ncbi:SsgA family sporulation/cell division regulator [Modestobacter muralis]|uniref:SsgA family sporulation/cell division regulator n=1 Tax=Modestobacter muralis TaxID=1608614 RepID=A0A6P0EX13_9ACTN|nr:SsgA family sporulation/cell division regulator [Modestobacter muralis]NEK96231.1 SsgA family sporulation/cell division regulator [Modestobacter muralis]NEN53119.1 SsgA family sporulation/cell division regulator [Modestobacter muralis]
MARYPRSGCTARTTLHLVGPQSWTAVPAALVYDASDPFAVRVRFGDGGEDEFDRTDDGLHGSGLGEDVPDEDGGVEWLLSRDLLRAGLTGPAGEGDVRLWPARGGLDVLFLQLRAPSGEALFELSAAVVGDFLRESEQLVAVGHESEALRVDDELSALLQGGSDPSGH